MTAETLLVARSPTPQPEAARLQLVSASTFDGRVGPRPRVTSSLAALAQVEQLAPLLGFRLKEGQLDSESSDVRDALIRQYYACLAQNISRDYALAPVWAMFQDRGIRTAFLKGAALVSTVYRDAGCRPMMDLDCLVPGEHWSSAIQAALESGGVWLRDPRRRVTTALGYVAEIVFAGRTILEIHRAFSVWPQFSVDYGGVLDRCVYALGRPGVPSPVDSFITLAIHAAKSGYVLPLRALVDGILLASTVRNAWDDLANRARAWSAQRALAIWVRVLLRFGLATEWEQLADSVAADTRRLDWIGAAPWNPSSMNTSPYDWRWRVRVARSLDHVWRPAAWQASLVFSRTGDHALRVEAWLRRRGAS